MPLPESPSIDEFDKAYPGTLSSRLGWLEEKLQLSRGRMLRLMGLSSQQATSVSKFSWSKIAKEYEDQADRVEHVLTHYLSYFEYDANKARDFSKEFSAKVTQGTHSLDDSIPAFAVAKTKGEKENALLAAIQEEGSSFVPALASFLAGKERNGRLRSTVLRKNLH